jgi:hypothetical protein
MNSAPLPAIEHSDARARACGVYVAIAASALIACGGDAGPSPDSGFDAGGDTGRPEDAAVEDDAGGCADECESPPSACFETAGTCVAGECVYAPLDGAACDDGDACTSMDSCAGGVCGGAAIECSSPRAPECIDTSLRTYASSGTCVAGTCEYTFEEAVCPSGCAGGECLDCSDDWHFETIVDCDCVLGEVVADGTGDLHLAFRRDDPGGGSAVQYGRRSAGGVWTEETVVPTSLWLAGDLGLDPAGGVHVALVDEFADQGFHAYRSPAGLWTRNAVTSVESTNEPPSMVLDGAGGIHVAVDDRSTGVLYGYAPGAGPFTFTPVASEGVASPRIALTFGETPHVIFALTERFWEVHHSFRTPEGTWSTMARAFGRTWLGAEDLAADGTGGLHVMYLPRLEPADLAYAYRDPSGTWTTVDIDSPPLAVDRSIYPGSLAVDESGGIHMAYVRVFFSDLGEVFELVYAHAAGPTGPWTLTVVRDPLYDIRLQPRVVLDESGAMHLVYTAQNDPSSSVLREATVCP